MTTKSTGRCKIDSIAVGDVVIDMFAQTGPGISAKFAYVDGQGGVRMGSGNRNSGWSPETFVRLLALVESLERDVLNDVFEEGAALSSDSAILADATDGVPSL